MKTLCLCVSLVVYLTPDFAADTLRFPGEERHLKNVRMLTHGGENAEAYFSPDGKYLSWQGHWDGTPPADQIWIMPADGGAPQIVSTGFGKTTCSFFIPGTDRLVYCSTHAHDQAPPPPVDMSKGYVWSLDEYDVYTVNRDGTDLRRLTDTPGYDAESAVSPDGKSIVFTSVRNGDLDLYTMDIDGSNVKQLTHTLGYDGGPFFSPDGKWIIFRSHLPETEGEEQRYLDLFAQRKVAPMRFELQIMRPDGSDRRQITNLGVASFAPYMHPDGKRVIFCSNYGSPVAEGQSHMPVFNLFIINLDGTGLEQITFNPTFDGFPMFSNDGKKLVWCSNRFGPHPRSTNIFIADWSD
jgi:Tol biopolymer transport system component